MAEEGAGKEGEGDGDDPIAGLELPDKLFFRIGEASQLVGVEPHVLRYWESEFRLRPQRSPSGQRMYRRKDISRFLRIRKLLHEEGFTIAGARKALREPTRAASPAQDVDSSRLGDGLQRLAEARSRIAAFTERIAKVGVAGVVGGDDA